MRKWLLLGMISFTILNTFAEQISPSQACIAVSNWLRNENRFSYRLGKKIQSSRVCQTKKGGLFHVIKLENKGFVITSGDTEIEPIIAFSSDNDLIEDNKNPLWSLLKKDIAARTERMHNSPPISSGPHFLSRNERHWKRLLTSSPILFSAEKKAANDLRIAPLTQSEWDQENYDGSYNYDPDKMCYNYYTPYYYACGCVATAGAQIMRYHCHPTSEVLRYSYACWINGVKFYLTMQGGFYNWDQMPLHPAQGITLEQRQEIGKLTSDVGISVNMQYYFTGSGAGLICLMRSFKKCFQYTNAKYVWFRPSNQDCPLPYTLDRLKQVVLPNLDAKLPVCMSISGPRGGHAVIVDGYGYDEEHLFLHVNLGWSGNRNAWYQPPNIDDFTAINEFVYNIYPTQTPDACIVSGRVLSQDGSRPLENVTVKVKNSERKLASCQTDVNGIYSFILPSEESYTMIADNGYTRQKKEIFLPSCQCITPTSQGKVKLRDQVIGNLCEQDFTLQETPPPILKKFLALATEGERRSIETLVDWSAKIEESVSWLELITTEGLACDPLILQADANTTGVARTATIEITPLGSGETISLVVSQGSQSWNFTAEKAFAQARKENKRIFLFSGYEDCPTCYDVYHVQCESLEAHDGVKKLLKDGYVLWLNNLSEKQNDATAYLLITPEAPHPQMRIIDPDTPEVPIAKIDGVPQEGQLQSWLIENGVTHSTGKVKVPYTWILENTTVTNFEFEANAWIDSDHDGSCNWEEFITGDDPKNPKTKLQCQIQIENGKPVITSSFTNSTMATCVIEGKANLTDKEWAPTNSTHRFFRARVIPK